MSRAWGRIYRSFGKFSLAACLAVAGCSSTRPSLSSVPVVSAPRAIREPIPPQPVRTVSFLQNQQATSSEPVTPGDPGDSPPDANHKAEPAISREVRPEHIATDGLFEGRTTLSLDELIVLVQERNPTLQAMYSAWQAAAARHPQEVSLEDPMLELMFAPRSFSGSSDVDESWAIQTSQKFPWPGKRQLRGEIANANAHSAALDADDTRLQIVLAVRLAYADYASAEQLLQLNTRESKLLDEIRTTASVRYETNQAPQQDVLQATVELSELKGRRVELSRARQVALARINTLLHRHPRSPLPPSTALTEADGELPGSEVLLELAVQSRPDLSSQGAKIAAEQAAICLALKEFYPDVELFARYDTMWFDPEQQTSMGLKLNLPVRRDRRWAAVREARARVSRAKAEYEARVAQIRYEVEAARERAIEARDVARLYSGEILQAADQNATSAQAGYVTGAISFVALIEAERQLIEIRRKAVELTAEHHRQAAELERAVGAPLPSTEPKDTQEKPVPSPQ